MLAALHSDAYRTSLSDFSDRIRTGELNIGTEILNRDSGSKDSDREFSLRYLAARREKDFTDELNSESFQESSLFILEQQVIPLSSPRKETRPFRHLIECLPRSWPGGRRAALCSVLDDYCQCRYIRCHLLGRLLACLFSRSFACLTPKATSATEYSG